MQDIKTKVRIEELQVAPYKYRMYPHLENSRILHLSNSNSKLNYLAKYLGKTQNQVLGLGFPSGYTCPFASICKTYCDHTTNTLMHGPQNEFDCFAARAERRPNVMDVVQHNKRIVEENWDNLEDLIIRSIEFHNTSKSKVSSVRFGTNGDLWDKRIWTALRNVSQELPYLDYIWGYTKNIHYALENKSETLPKFRVAYSYGTIFDKMEKYKDVHKEVVTAYVQTYENEHPVETVCKHKNTPDYAGDYVKICIEQKSFGLGLH